MILDRVIRQADKHVRTIQKTSGQAVYCGVDAAYDMNVFDDSYYAPSYNVAPQSLKLLVRLSPDTGERELHHALGTGAVLV